MSLHKKSLPPTNVPFMLFTTHVKVYYLVLIEKNVAFRFNIVMYKHVNEVAIGTQFQLVFNYDFVLTLMPNASKKYKNLYLTLNK